MWKVEREEIVFWDCMKEEKKDKKIDKVDGHSL